MKFHKQPEKIHFKYWTIRMMQFFDYYLKGTKEPRWMKEGIHLRERGIDQKYDLLKK